MKNGLIRNAVLNFGLTIQECSSDSPVIRHASGILQSNHSSRIAEPRFLCAAGASRREYWIIRDLNSADFGTKYMQRELSSLSQVFDTEPGSFCGGIQLAAYRA